MKREIRGGLSAGFSGRCLNRSGCSPSPMHQTVRLWSLFDQLQTQVYRCQSVLVNYSYIETPHDLILRSITSGFDYTLPNCLAKTSTLLVYVTFYILCYYYILIRTYNDIRLHAIVFPPVEANRSTTGLGCRCSSFHQNVPSHFQKASSCLFLAGLRPCSTSTARPTTPLRWNTWVSPLVSWRGQKPRCWQPTYS